MLCSINKQIFPRDNMESSNGFYIMSYICNEHSKECADAVCEDGSDLYGEVFIAKGHYLPRSRGCQYDIKGHWEYDRQKDRRTFVIDTIDTIVEKNERAIKDFLVHSIDGLGPKTTDAIFLKFGLNTLDVFENSPEKLLTIKGISQKKYEKIVISYQQERGARDVVMTLVPLGISHKMATKIYSKLRDESIDIIANHPFRLCRFKGISFNLADSISEKNGLNPQDPERISAALIDVLYQAEYGGELFRFATGHLCVQYNEWIQKAYLLLKYTVNIATIEQCALTLRQKQEICAVSNPYTKDGVIYVFRKEVHEVEVSIAESIASIVTSNYRSKINCDEEIRIMELKEKVSLAPEQRNAVKIGLSNQFAVITGGPGTGKTTIIKFIRNIYMKNNKNKKILMCSPTGVAATRMSESTNGEACTVHKALNLAANDEGMYDDTEPLDYDLIIVDETSMLDIYLAKVLFKAVASGTKLLFIGDVDQLPSVGPGAVLRDIIESNVVPVAVLTKVYRQADGSLIALNALLINQGKCSFDYGEAFQFIPANSFDEAAFIMKDLYLKEIKAKGINNVMMLSPFRQKTASGVNSLNSMRDEANPPSPEKAEVVFGNKTYREGDKIIQLKNVDNISNGDIGFITKIYEDKNKTFVKIDFGHDRIVDYSMDDLDLIDWSYAMTVHKSQGSEADTVIFNLLDGHGIMLKRNLLYTAITRAKKKVYIIGSMSAIQKAVSSGLSNEDRRITLLSPLIRYFVEKKKAA